MLVKMLILFCMLLQMGCATLELQRSQASGYSSYSSDLQEVSLNSLDRNKDFQSRSLASIEVADLNLEKTIDYLQSQLNSPEERSHYLKYKNILKPQDKVSYLKLPDILTRERWLHNKGLATDRAVAFPPSVISLIEEGDIALGMTKDAVIESWGDPEVVEISGHPRFENEKWKFTIPIPSPEGYKIEQRFVFFTNGRVSGWKTY